MSPTTAERPEVELGDPPAARTPRRPRWTVGRVVTDIAIVAVAVPFALNWIVPRAPEFCAMTTGYYVFSLGATCLGARAAWLVLKALNDAAERWLDRRVRPDRDTPRRNPTP